MDREGFRDLLKTRNLNDEEIEDSIEIAEQFETYLKASSSKTDSAITWEFCKILMEEEQNSYIHFLALARYGRYTKNNAIYVAMLELLDGAEAQPNLYKKVGEEFGEVVRDEAFAGVGISILGVPPQEKPFDMFPVIDRLIELVGYEALERLLSDCLRDLPDDYFMDERAKYIKTGDIDLYLKKKHQALVELLQKCQRNGELFFSQEVTADVVRYVKNNQEIESGVRQGNLLFITKIPYNTKQYLTETDPTMKRYYACHCPWAREAVKSEAIQMNPIFCNCSGGFSKKPWEVISGQQLKVDQLESVLKGDFQCRFAVHLPENLVVEN